MKRLSLSVLGLGLVLSFGCPIPNPPGPTPPKNCLVPPDAIKPRVSLAVTDMAILDDRFSLQRVMNKIVETGGTPFSADELYQRLFDTNNSAKNPGANFAKKFFVPSGQHCDDTQGSTGATLNGFPLECPRQEGGLADLSAHEPFCTSGSNCDPYVPLAIFNRLDVAPNDFANCGQVHLVYGRKPPSPSFANRTLIIFEAVVPNPTPGQSNGCLPVAKFWLDLGNTSDPQMRAQMLEKFLFGPSAPVIQLANFGGDGGIRTDQFKNSPGLGQNWQLREFKLTQSCAGGSCKLTGVAQVTVKRNPFGALFDPTNASPMAQAFQDPNNPKGFISQMKGLAMAQSISDITLSTDDMFNGGQSSSQTGGQNEDTDYTFWFTKGQGAFRSAIQAQLTQMGSSLTPENIVARAQTQTCAGCHQISNGADLGGGLQWPSKSQPFVQVFEMQPEACQPETGTPMCWPLTEAVDVFLQSRRDDLLNFAQTHACAGTAIRGQGLVRPRVRIPHTH